MHHHESHVQLSAKLDEAAKYVTVGARYRHYKQLDYKVLALALREEDNETVCYLPDRIWRSNYLYTPGH